MRNFSSKVLVLATCMLLVACGGGELRSVRGAVIPTPPQHFDLCIREPEAAVCPK